LAFVALYQEATMKNQYEDGVVVITGAATGRGRAIASGAAQAGARRYRTQLPKQVLLPWGAS